MQNLKQKVFHLINKRQSGIGFDFFFQTNVIINKSLKMLCHTNSNKKLRKLKINEHIITLWHMVLSLNKRIPWNYIATKLFYMLCLIWTTFCCVAFVFPVVCWIKTTVSKIKTKRTKYHWTFTSACGMSLIELIPYICSTIFRSLLVVATLLLLI